MEPNEVYLKAQSKEEIKNQEKLIEKCFGDNFGPYFYFYIELDLCDLFKISILKLEDGIKEAFKKEISKCSGDADLKRKVNLNIAYELFKNPNFRPLSLDCKTGILKACISDNTPFLSHIFIICNEFNLIFYLYDLNLLQIPPNIPYYCPQCPYLYKSEDSGQRDFLYLASLCNYPLILRHILSWKINIDHQQSTGSTALHASAYYGHKEIVMILMKHGASFEVKNNFGNTPLDEANDKEIKMLIQSFTKEKIYRFIKDVRSFFPCGCQEIFDEFNRHIGFYVENPFENQHAELNLHYNQEAFHGTKLKNVLSIMKNGFVVPGESTKDGVKIEIQKGHIASQVTIDGIKDFANAIFISRSPFYASDPCYAETFESFNNEYIVLLKLMACSNAYSIHQATTFPKYICKNGENSGVELRVPFSKFIRIDGVYFLEKKFFQSLKNFGDFWKFYSLKKTFIEYDFDEILKVKRYPIIKHFGINESKGNQIKLNIDYQMHNEVFEIWVKTDIKMKNLYEIVMKKLNLPEKVFGLFFQGQYLNSAENMNKGLLDFKIKHESKIYILFRNRG